MLYKMSKDNYCFYLYCCTKNDEHDLTSKIKKVLDKQNS